MKTFQLEGKSREVAATSADLLYCTAAKKYLISLSRKTASVIWFTALKSLL